MTKAASNLAISKSLVSVHLRSLERTLGARLLERTTRRLTITQTGQDVLAAADRMLAAADDVARIAESKQGAPRGVLRVGASVEVGTLLVAPAVARLCTRYPELRAELLLTDEPSDPIAHRLDVVVSVNVPKDSTLISTRLGEDLEIVVASPELAHSWRGATEPKHLASAPWVAHPAIPPSARQFRSSRGTVQRVAPVEPRVVANTGDAIRSLVVGGAGFAVLPYQMVADDLHSGRMVRVLTDWRRRKVTLHACLPSRSNPPARATLFLQEFREVFRITGFEARFADGVPRHLPRHPRS